MKEKKVNIEINLVLLRLIFLSISSSSLSKSLIKKNWVVIKKMKGKVS